MNGHTCPSSVAADFATSRGILVVASAGNSGNNQWHYISAPSDGDSVIAVAAVDAEGIYVSFSSYGPSSDGDIKPNVAAKGANATVADPFGTIGGANGTSFSCPILAGAATCLLQAHPDKSVVEIKDAIERSANYFLTPTDTLGYGIPNFGNAHLLLSNIEDRNTISPFVVYPNPMQDKLNVQLFSNSNQEVTVKLFGLLGNVVSEMKSNIYGGNYTTLELAVPANLASGMYFVQVEMGSTIFLERVVRN